MKAAIVLLADSAIHNYARRIVFDLNSTRGVPFYASLLPAHVSLKQPFAFEDIDGLERYFDAFAASIAPFEVALDRLYAETWNGYGILGLKAAETPELRALHDRLNAELPAVVRDAAAPHDGSGYRFHLTIEMGRLDEAAGNPFQDYYDRLPDPRVDLRFTARELAMFYYPAAPGPTPSFITLRVRPLG